MTIKEKGEKLYQSFLLAWENYIKIDNKNTSAGFKELLSAPELKAAYQKWQSAVSDYYDFAKSIEGKDVNQEFTGK